MHSQDGYFRFLPRHENELSYILSHNELQPLFINEEMEGEQIYNELRIILKYSLFLLRTNRLADTELLSLQYIRQLLSHYWFRLDSEEAQTIKQGFEEALRRNYQNWQPGITKEYFLYYWSLIDEQGAEQFSIIDAVRTINNPDPKADHNIRIFPRRTNNVSNIQLQIETYDMYIKNLSINLYEKSQYFDLIMLDSIQTSEYLSRGSIHSFEHLFHGIANSQDYSILRNSDPIIETVRTSIINNNRERPLIGIPITRNFHLPAFGRAFDKNNATVDFIRKFIEETRNLSDLIDVREIKKLHNFYKSIIDINNNNRITSVWNESGSQEVRRLKLYKYFNFFSDEDSTKDDRECLEKFYCKKEIYTNEELYKKRNEYTKQHIPFTLEMDSPFFIPMQLGRGNHASYTLMAYTANAGQQSLIQIQDSSLSISPQLENRLQSILELIFLYVPTISLSLDHLLASVMRKKNAKSWFDPCLPIEAIGFHDNRFRIEVSPEPAQHDGQSLSCLGGFCLCVTRFSRDDSGAANAAYLLVSSLQNQANESLINSPVRSNNSRISVRNILELTRSDWVIPSNNSSIYIQTPFDAAHRPNINFWPLIEAKISFIFRHYVAALFVFRAIHFESIYLQSRLYEEIEVSGLNTLDNIFGDNAQSEFERLCGGHRSYGLEAKYINSLKSTQIRRYFINVMNFTIAHFNFAKEEFAASSVREEKHYANNINLQDIEMNFKDIIADSDYICGILQYAAEQAEQQWHDELYINTKNDDNRLIIDDHNAQVLYRRAGLFMTAMANAMNDSLRKEIENEFRRFI